MLVPGVDVAAFGFGLGACMVVLFAAWVPLAGVGLVRRLLGMS